MLIIMFYNVYNVPLSQSTPCSSMLPLHAISMEGGGG